MSYINNIPNPYSSIDPETGAISFKKAKTKEIEDKVESLQQKLDILYELVYELKEQLNNSKVEGED